MSQEQSKVSVVVPLHELPKQTRVTKRRPGQPKKIEKQPTLDDLTYHAEMVRERDSYVSDHEMVKASKPKALTEGEVSGTVATLQSVKYQIAREAVTLEFNRRELEKRGVDTSQISSRIVTTWKQLADLELEIKKLGSVVVDPKSEPVQRILKLWINTLQTIVRTMIAEKTMSPEVSELFFNKFAAAMEGWEDRLRD